MNTLFHNLYDRNAGGSPARAYSVCNVVFTCSRQPPNEEDPMSTTGLR
jgi:hypothetical protein